MSKLKTAVKPDSMEEGKYYEVHFRDGKFQEGVFYRQSNDHYGRCVLLRRGERYPFLMGEVRSAYKK